MCPVFRLLAVLAACVFVCSSSIHAQPEYTVLEGYPAFDWVDMSSATETGLFGDDAAAGPFPIGFSFEYYGETYEDFYLNTNGGLIFNERSTSLYGCNPENNYAALVPVGDDLESESSAGTRISYVTNGTIGSRQLVVEWQNAFPYNNQYDQLQDFQVILREGSNFITFQYNNYSVPRSFQGIYIESHLGFPATVYSACNVEVTDGLVVTFASLPQPSVLLTDSQTYFTGQSPQTLGDVLISDHPTTPVITASGDLRLVIPADNPIIFDPSTPSLVSLSGPAASKVSASVSLEPDSKTLVLDVLEDFSAADSFTVSGILVADFTEPLVGGSLELDYGGLSPVQSRNTYSIEVASPEVTTAFAPNLFQLRVDGLPYNLNRIMVTEHSVVTTITAGNDLRFGWQNNSGGFMSWDDTVTQLTLSGPAASKVSPNVTYEDDGQIAVVDVLQDLVPGDAFNIDGLGVGEVRANAPNSTRMTVLFQPSVPAIVQQDLYSISPSEPTAVLAESPSYLSGQQNLPLPSMVITDHPAAKTIRADRDIRIELPAGAPADWDGSVTEVVLSGSAASKVGSTVTYEPGAAILDVLQDFAPGESITVEGLRLNTLPNSEGSFFLRIEYDPVIPRSILAENAISVRNPIPLKFYSSGEQTFLRNAASTNIRPITIQESPDIASIAAGSELLIEIPSSLAFTWEPSDLQPLLEGTAAGKVEPLPTLRNDDLTLVFSVTADFAVSDTLRISSLAMTGFTKEVAPDYLELEYADGTQTSDVFYKQVNRLGQYVTSVDNQDNARTGLPDGDFEGCLYNSSSVSPIEATVDVVGPPPFFSAQILVFTNDVDFPDEIDEVYLNGNLVGVLTGIDSSDGSVVLDVPDLSWVQQGKNDVEIRIDVNNDGWCIRVYSFALLIDGGSPGDIEIRELATDLSNYAFGNSVNINYEIDTNDESTRSVIASLSIVDPVDTLVSVTDQTYTITGTSDDEFSAALPIPSSGQPGVYKVRLTVLDAATLQLEARQDLQVFVGDSPAVDNVVFAPAAILNDGIDTALLTCDVSDPQGPEDVAFVVANLSPIGGANDQPLFDDGTNGDSIAEDGIYSFGPLASIASPGLYTIEVTATDTAELIGRRNGTITLADNLGPRVSNVRFDPSVILNTNTIETYLVAEVSDPEGLEDVVEVIGNLTALGLGTVTLADDGTTGDQNAGDGTYSFGPISTTASSGEYVVAVVAVDSDGRRGTSTGVLTVRNNNAPISDAGPNQTVAEGTNVNLDGSASEDPDGDAIRYQWTQTQGFGVSLFGTTTANASFRAPNFASDQNLEFRLRVTDAFDLYSSDTVTVTVEATNEPPFFTAGPNSTISALFAGESTTLTASAQPGDAEDAVSYLWEVAEGPGTLTGEETSTAIFTAPALVDALTAVTVRITVTDNIGGQVSRTLSLELLPPPPDLTVAILDSPTTAGLSKEVAVEWQIRNDSTGTGTEGTRAQLWLSTNPSSPGGQRLDEQAVPPLGPGAVASFSSLVTIPSSSIPGEFYIQVVSDAGDEQRESDESNNIATVPMQVFGSDLIPLILEVPAELYPNDIASVSYTAKNVGDLAAETPWLDALYLSEDDQVGNDVLAGTFLNPGGLAPGEEVSLDIDVSVPDTPGEYYVILRLDSENIIPEGFERDGNYLVSEGTVQVRQLPAADLVAVEIIAPASVFSGNDFTIEYTVRNDGNYWTANTGWSEAIYISQASAFSPQDARLLGKLDNLSSLQPEESYSQSATFSLPYTDFGEFYIFVRMDSDNAVREYAGEQNNVTRSDERLVVNLAPTPDLNVVSVVAPTNSFSGSPLAITFTVGNQGLGATRVGTWSDEAFLSLDTVLDPSDRQLGMWLHTGSLESGSQYTVDVSPALPLDVDGDWYVIVRTDVHNNVFEYLDEENNVTARTQATNITLSPPPDMVVVSVMAPEQAITQQRIQVSYRVENDGPGDVPNTGWADAIFLSEDTTLDQGDLLLEQHSVSENLPAAGGYEQTRQVAIPGVPPGEYYLIVMTDYGRNVFEFEWEDNNSNFATLLVQSPDLKVSGIVVEETPASGLPLTVRYTTTNDGPVEAMDLTWTDNLYLSEDEIIDDTDVLLLSQSVHGPLLGQESRELTFGVTLPEGVEGSQYLIASVNHGRNLFEDPDIAPNVLAIPIEVALTPSPDLVVEAEMQTSSPLLAGDEATVLITVLNQGLAALPEDASWTTRVYRSRNTTIDDEDVPLATYIATGLLAPDGATTRSISFIAPSNVQGDFFILAEVDTEDDVYEHQAEDNNRGTSAPFTIQAYPTPPPDLLLTQLEREGRASSGRLLTVRWTVANQGIGPVPGLTWVDRVYLSETGDRDFDDALVLGQSVRTGSLDQAATYTVEMQVRLPQGISGNFFLMAETDAGNDVAELGEGNNLSVALPLAVELSPSPDLAVTGLVTPEMTFAGQQIELSWTVRNAGQEDTGNGPWFDEVYFSRDWRFSNDDLSLGSVRRNGPLARGASYEATAIFDLPSNLEGPYFVAVRTDVSEVLFDPNRNNNTAINPRSVFVAIPDPADLIVDAITVPSTAILGGEATFAWSVRNAGINEAIGRWSDAVYLSSDDTWSSDDVRLGSELHSGTVAVQETYNSQLTAAIPALLPGEYFVLVRTDVRNQLVETTVGEQNNIHAADDRIMIGAERLVLGETTVGTIDPGQERHFLVTVPEGEVLRFTAEAETTGYLEMFVTYGTASSRADHDLTFRTPFSSRQQLVVSDTYEGDYYVLVRGEGLEPDTPVAIHAELLDFDIYAFDPLVAGNRGVTTLRLSGARFSQGTTFFLRNDVTGESIGTTESFVQDSATAFASFNLLDKNTGAYSLIAEDSILGSRTADAPLQVVPGSGPQVVARLFGPASVRPGRDYIFNVTYTNNGDSDAVAPLMLISSPSRTLFGLDSEDLQSGSTFQLLGLSSTGLPQVLRPREVHSIPIFFNTSTNSVHFDLATMTTQNSGFVGWEGYRDGLRPPEISPQEWERIFPQLTQRLGETWGSYVGELLRTSVRAALVDRRPEDVRVLWDMLIEEVIGLGDATIAGIVYDSDTGLPVVDTTVIVRALSPDGVIRSATTDDTGQFQAGALLEDRYQLVVEGYRVLGPQQVLVERGQELTDLLVETEKLPADEDTTPAPIHHAPKALVVEGAQHLFFSSDGFIVHSANSGSGWSEPAPVSTATGYDYDVTYDPDLFAPGEGGFLLIFGEEEGDGSQMKLVAGSSDGADGWEWSTASDYFKGSVSSSSPALEVTPDGNPLAVWKMQNRSDIEDDSDLYYQYDPLPDFEWVMVKAILTSDQPTLLDDGTVIPEGSQFALLSDGTAIHIADGDSCDTSWKVGLSKEFEFKKNGQVPKYIPYIGGSNRLDVNGTLAGEANTRGATATGSVTGSVNALNERLTGSATGQVNAAWKLDKEKCTFVFDKADASLGIGLEGRVPIPQLSAKLEVFGIQIYHQEVGFRLAGTLTGVLSWTAQGGARPDGAVRGDVAGGLYGFIKVLDGEGAAELSGQGVIPFMINARGFSLDPQTSPFFSGTASVKVGSRKFEATIHYPGSRPALERVFQNLDDALKQVALATETRIAVSIEPKMGRSFVYGSTAVLADVGRDYSDDGRPVLYKTASGSIYLFWVRYPGPSEEVLGDTLQYSRWNGNSWSAPQEVPGSFGFNGKPVVAEDAGGSLMVAWASGDADGLTLDSDPNEAISAANRQDLHFSTMMPNGVWSAKQTLDPVQDLEGAMQHLTTATLPDGRVLTTWVSADTTTRTLKASFWNGSDWSPITEIDSGLITDYPTIVADDSNVSILVALDPGGVASADQSKSAQLHEANFTENGWSKLSPLVFGEVGQKQASPITGEKTQKGTTTASFSLTLSVPDCVCDTPTPTPTPIPSEPHPTPPPPPTLGPTGDECAYCPSVIRPTDPNDKVGPAGVGEARAVPYNEPMLYRINFENVETASAPAQRVMIEDRLTTTGLDMRTLRLHEIGFSGHVIPLPGRSFTTLDYDLPTTAGLAPLQVRITAGLDIRTETARWILQTIDTTTGEPPADARLGFLPPNDAQRHGEGYVTFSILPNEDLAAGTRVENIAEIVFDEEAPIITPLVWNTVDRGAPSSRMSELPPVTRNRTVNLSWTASDADSGAGIENVGVYVSRDGAPYELVKTVVARSTAEFMGDYGSTYAFYTVARDRVGLVEAEPTEPDAETTLLDPNAPTDPSNPVPNDGALEVPVTTTFSWIGGERADSHSLFLWTEGEDRPSTYTVSDLGTSWQPSQPLPGLTQIFWQVAAINSSGVAVGPEWSFTTSEPLPATPTNPNPIVGAHNVLVETLTLGWQSDENAGSYDVWLWPAGESRPTSPVAAQLTDPRWTLSSYLVTDTDYSWQVRAHSSNRSVHVEGPVWSFSTRLPYPIFASTNPPGLQIIVDGETELAPASFVGTEGASLTLEAPALQPITPLSRWRFLQWDDGTKTAERSVPIGPDGATYTAVYGREFLLILDSEYGDRQGEGWYAEGSSACWSVGPAPADECTRFRADSPTTGCLTLDTPTTVTVSWVPQHRLAIASDGLGNPQGAGWYDRSTTATWTVTTPWAGTTGVRYRTAVTSGTVVLNDCEVVSIDWTTEYRLTLDSAYGDPQGDGWYESGTEACWTVTTPQPDTECTRLVLAQDNASGCLTMTQPRTLTLPWNRELRSDIQRQPEDGGTVIIEPAPADGWIGYDSTVTLRAIPAPQYVFIRWEGLPAGVDSANSEVQINLTECGAITAHFAIGTGEAWILQ